MLKHPAVLVVWYVAETGLIYWGLANGVSGVGNLVKALALWGVLTAPALVYLGLDAKTTVDRPKWMGRFANWGEVVQILILAWFGWMWCAAAWAISAFAAMIFRDRDGKGPMSERVKRAEQQSTPEGKGV